MCQKVSLILSALHVPTAGFCLQSPRGSGGETPPQHFPWIHRPQTKASLPPPMAASKTSSHWNGLMGVTSQPSSLSSERLKGETQQGLQPHPLLCSRLLPLSSGTPCWLLRDHQPPRRLFPSSQNPRTVLEGKAHQPGSVHKEEALEGVCPELGCKVSGWCRHKGVARTCTLGGQARDGGAGRTGNRFCGWALTLSSLQPVSCFLSL